MKRIILFFLSLFLWSLHAASDSKLSSLRILLDYAQKKAKTSLVITPNLFTQFLASPEWPQEYDPDLPDTFAHLFSPAHRLPRDYSSLYQEFKVEEEKFNQQRVPLQKALAAYHKREHFFDKLTAYFEGASPLVPSVDEYVSQEDVENALPAEPVSGEYAEQVPALLRQRLTLIAEEKCSSLTYAIMKYLTNGPHQFLYTDRN